MPAGQAHRAALSREAVVAKALQLLDASGLEALTMRSLAASLGVSAPTLYWHFDNRADLLAAVSAALMSELPAPAHETSSSDDWRVSVREMLMGLWELHHRHPAFLHVVGQRPLHSPEGEAMFTRLLVVLRRAHYPAQQAVQLARSFLWLGFGLIRGAEAASTRLAGSHTINFLVDLTDVASSELLVECIPFISVLNPKDIYVRTIDLALAGAAQP